MPRYEASREEVAIFAASLRRDVLKGHPVAIETNERVAAAVAAGCHQIAALRNELEDVMTAHLALNAAPQVA